MSDPIDFADGAAFGAWLEANHATAADVWVVLHKRSSPVTGRPRWADLVPEALRFGWIDSVSRPLDEHRRQQRFSPRKSTRWSQVNVDHVERLLAAGRMHPAGLAAYALREGEAYSLSNRPDQLAPEHDAVLRANPAAAVFWDTTPPSYRKSIAFWLSDAKRPETQQRRLAQIVDACERGERLR